jgi:hypothetical protein
MERRQNEVEEVNMAKNKNGARAALADPNEVPDGRPLYKPPSAADGTTQRVLLYRETVTTGEKLTDALASLAARLTLDGLHPESYEVQRLAISLHAQLGAYRFRAKLDLATGDQ